MFKGFLQDVYAIYILFIIFVFHDNPKWCFVSTCIWVCLCQVLSMCSYRTRLRHTHYCLSAMSRSARYRLSAGEDHVNVFSIDKSSPREYRIERARRFVETLNVVSLREIESLWICCQWRSDGVESDVTSDNTHLDSSDDSGSHSSEPKHVQVTLHYNIRKSPVYFAWRKGSLCLEPLTLFSRSRRGEADP